jgi:transcriptional regulator with PAS, ATPase and Fis domain
MSIQVPPLRERVEDIPQLAALFLDRFSEKHGKAVKKIAPETLQILENYPWPGNIRELENLIERAVVMTHFEEITLLPSHLSRELTVSGTAVVDGELPPENDLSALMAGYERQVIEEALNSNKWNQTQYLRSSDPLQNQTAATEKTGSNIE